VAEKNVSRLIFYKIKLKKNKGKIIKYSKKGKKVKKHKKIFKNE
jgi:hypothetical protein